MRKSVLLPQSLTAGSSRALVAWVRHAEDADVDTITLHGRVVRDSLEPLVALTLVAATSRRAELVLRLPAHDLARPRILERQIAALQRASRGRLTVARLRRGPSHQPAGEPALRTPALV